MYEDKRGRTIKKTGFNTPNMSDPAGGATASPGPGDSSVRFTAK